MAPLKLPDCEKAIVDITKLSEYSLNPDHEVGGHKARVFSSALGLTPDDAEWLRAELLRIACEGDATPGEPSLFGEKYVIDEELAYEGYKAIVRSAWIIETGTKVPRLISCYVIGGKLDGRNQVSRNSGFVG